MGQRDLELAERAGPPAVRLRGWLTVAGNMKEGARKTTREREA